MEAFFTLTARGRGFQQNELSIACYLGEENLSPTWSKVREASAAWLPQADLMRDD